MVRKYGFELDETDAIRDGFESVEGLIKALGDINAMTKQQVLDWEWGILNFAWQDGYPRRVAKEDRPYYVRREDDETE